ncbi:unnamed protein product [Allacma fusca]|uniref:Uncharacterized protein n=1 Tax=Allacma fusca TaxID=39272 RepID=A0A8J2PNH1_9HEXA|nr:unnamed protein product [Allacma fusca]
MDNSLSIFSDYAFHKPEIGSTDLASALFLLLSGSTPADSVITNVSVIQSWNWFFMLTPFESIFLGFIIAQIAVLNILGILPIKLNTLFTGDPTGRKKRHVGGNLKNRENMAHTVVNVSPI